MKKIICLFALCLCALPVSSQTLPDDVVEALAKQRARQTEELKPINQKESAKIADAAQNPSQVLPLVSEILTEAQNSARIDSNRTQAMIELLRAQLQLQTLLALQNARIIEQNEKILAAQTKK